MNPSTPATSNIITPNADTLASFEFMSALAQNGSAPILVSEDGTETGFRADLDIAMGTCAVLATEEGSALGLAIKSDFHRARADLDIFGEPSIAIKAADDRVALIYLYENPISKDSLNELNELILTKTGHDALDQIVPIPGLAGADFATDRDADALSTRLQRFESRGLLDRLRDYEPPATNLEEAADEVLKDGDLEYIGGQLPQTVLDLPLKLGFGSSREQKRWPAKAMVFANLLTGLSVHKEGKKNGPAFLQGSAIQNERKASAMEALYVVGLDVDSGVQLDWAINRIQNELKLTAIFYTTHSHLTTETVVLQSSYAQFTRKRSLSDEVAVDAMRRYMVEEKSWERWVADTIQISEEPVHGPDGIGYALTHAPIPKFRIIFPLSEPYVIAKQRMSQADAINLWKSRLLGLAQHIGLPIDKSCLDPSRLFYLPRHDKSRAYRIVVTSGSALVFATLPAAQSRLSERPAANLFSRAAGDLGAHTGNSLVVNGTNLKFWAKQVAGTFDAPRLIREVCGDKIRSENGSDKIEIVCPFDMSHSNAGDQNDTACYVKSAHADYSESGFAWGCQHNSCKTHDRLDFVCEAIKQGWFTVEDIVDKKYRIFTVDDHEPESTGRDQISVAEDHTTAVEKALNALIAANVERPRLFIGAGGLVRPETNKATGFTSLSTVTTKTLQHEIRKVVAFTIARNNHSVRETQVPPAIADDILQHDDLDFPVLNGIVNTPFFVQTPEAIKLVSTPGYNAPSGYLYKPAPGLLVSPVPESPSARDVARAKDLILENVYADFPFDDGDDTNGAASRAHTLCLLLQPFMRGVIDGPTPGFFISKPSPGTGAGKMVDATMLIATGSPGEARTETKDEDERRKSIVAALRSGTNYHWLDNLHADLDSAVYASAITSGFLTARILQTSDELRLPVRLTWVFSGNNPRASGELVRRFVPIFLDAKGDPTKRTAFKHPELEVWVRENRSELVWACLTLIQAWVAAGAPKDRTSSLPSFEAWSATFRGLLNVIEIPGFLTNCEKLKEAADNDLDAWGALASVWADLFGLDKKRPIGNPGGVATQDKPWDGEASLVSLIESHGIQIKITGITDNGRTVSLGKALDSKKNSVLNAQVGGVPCDLILRKERDPVRGSHVYWLERARN